ncbi:caspase-2 [Erpetoichthys calabaricus]|uniref:caspase-2 n=1 Tax=Erpetoichthys calabaricus TaxID=27687 RepID=UPI0022342F7E|nr:caspase-2 [Erpetoichthys calabaricus]
MLGEFGMSQCHQEALKKHRVILAKQLVPGELLQHLLAADILTDEMVEKIMSNGTTYSQNVELLSLLPKRGPSAFKEFCLALVETKQEHLEHMIQMQAKFKKQISDLPLPVQEENGHRPKRARKDVAMEFSLDSGDGPVPHFVQPCTDGFYQKLHRQAYRMQSLPRGQALILSNTDFDTNVTELDPRPGGKEDESTLCHLFTELSFQVTLICNKSSQDMKNILVQFSRHKDHQSADACIVALLSHGIEGAVYGVDGELLKLDDVFSFFDNASSPNLQNKPKMFFIQACRGEMPDVGVDQLDGSERAESPGCEQRDAGISKPQKPRLPTQSDMICGYASLKGTAALRNTKQGSWFVQALNIVFCQRAKDRHVADMLVEVNALIKSREGYAPGTEFHRCKEMSEFTSSLCKDLYLFPGHPQANS